MSELDERLREVEEQLSYCEKLVLAETRLQLATLLLEELLEKVQQMQESAGENSTHLRALSEKIKLLYHRAKALLSLQEGTSNKSMYRTSED